jgi:hypothetical protein
MEILLVIIVLAVIAAAAFMWYRSRNEGPAGLSGGGPALRGRRGAARASRVDPMADVVERHAMATDPHEAAEAEVRLQAQANRVAADLHAQQASALESEAGRGGGLRARGSAMPADAYGGPPVDAYGGAPPVDAYGRPVGAAGDAYGQPAYDDAGRPVYVDGQPVYQDGAPVDEYGRPVAAADDGAAYYDEQGRPVYPEDRPRY